MYPRPKLLPLLLLCFLVTMLAFIYLLKDKGENKISTAQIMKIFEGRTLNGSGELLCIDQKCKQKS